MKFLKDFLFMTGRNAAAVISHGDGDFLISGYLRLHHDAAMRRGKFQGIVEQIMQDWLKAVSIRSHRHFTESRGMNGDGFALCRVLKIFRHFADDLSNRDGVEI